MATDAPAKRGPIQPAELREPPLARFLFGDTRVAILWLIVRLYVGYEWVQAGLEKVTSPAWTGAQSGVALTGFVNGALKQTTGDHPNVQGWYGTFLRDVVLPNASLWSHLVAYGETLVGVALLLGVLTGLAAFFGIVMNANYLLAGAVSTNPVLIILGALLMLAWRNAGWIGADHWLLPALGTPWQPGSVFRARDRRARDRRATDRAADRRTAERRLATANSGDIPDVVEADRTLPKPAFDPDGTAAYENRSGLPGDAAPVSDAAPVGGAARGFGGALGRPADAIEPTRLDDTAPVEPIGSAERSARMETATSVAPGFVSGGGSVEGASPVEGLGPLDAFSPAEGRGPVDGSGPIQGSGDGGGPVANS